MQPPIITVMTVPKRPQYWRETVAMLDAAGASRFEDKYIMVDGDSDQICAMVPDGWRVHECHADKQSLGTHETLLAILRFGDLNRDKLLFEDDLADGVDDGVIAMAKTDVPDDCAFLSFVDIRKGGEEPAIVRRSGEIQGHIAGVYNNEGHWGNQALKVPSRSLKYLATAELPARTCASDVYLGVALATPPSPWPYVGYVQPSFFKHAGPVSTVQRFFLPFYGYGRETKNCPGPGFKALNILDRLV
jgi:hypothetical protein